MSSNFSHPRTDFDSDIVEASAAGNLGKLASLIEERHPSTSYLTHGLYAAVLHGQLQAVRYLLDRGAVAEGTVTLVAALRSKSLPIFQSMLEHGWNINTPFLMGQTALMAVTDDESLVRWFLSNGADPNLGPPDHIKPNSSEPVSDSGAILNMAACVSTPTVYKLLLEHGAKLEYSVPLHTAASSQEDEDRISMMAYLLELGVDINGFDDRRGLYATGTPLHAAIEAGGIAKVRFLLEQGADPILKHDYKGTPMQAALALAQPAIIELLKEHPS